MKNRYTYTEEELRTAIATSVSLHEVLKKLNLCAEGGVPHPTKDELEKLLWEKPTSQIAKQFGVSDKAIEKWSKLYGLKKPSRGYWRKVACGKLNGASK
jgi:transposase-like protein